MSEQIDKIVADITGDTIATRVITIRVPATQHAALKEEAHELRTSVNKLAIVKLAEPFVIVPEQPET
jgi:hypothetical protein